MKKSNAVFREKALRNYVQSKEQAVLPRFVSPRTFSYLWILLVLLFGCVAGLWFARVPAYVSGLGVVCIPNDGARSLSDDDGMIIAAFMPPQTLAHLQVGQKMLIRLEPSGIRLSRTVTNVKPEVISPDEAQREFSLNTVAAQSIGQPSVVVIARFEHLPPNALPARSYVGGIYHVDVEFGSRRLISMLPLIGHLIGD